jgi:hypothetical protein
MRSWRPKEAGELPADADAADLAEAILAHLKGLFVLAKARNEPAVFERLPVDVRRLAGLPVGSCPDSPAAASQAQITCHAGQRSSFQAP